MNILDIPIAKSQRTEFELGPTILIEPLQCFQFQTNHLKSSHICPTSPWNSPILETLVEFNIDTLLSGLALGTPGPHPTMAHNSET